MTIQIACCIDNNFVMQYSVLMASLKTSNPYQEFHIHLLGNGLNAVSKDSVGNISKSLDLPVTVYDVNIQEFSNKFPRMYGNTSLATYLRCFVTEFLPKELEKVIYLDCDMVVMGDISTLWNISVEDNSVLAIEDMWALHNDNPKRLGYDSSYSYFNAGMLVINLNYWRNENVTQKTLDYLVNYPDRLDYHDQDILNSLFYSTRKFICPKYNMQDGFYRRRRRYMPKELAAEAEEWLWKPVVLHYTGGAKPWHYKSYHPLKMEFYKYLDLTPFKGWRPDKKLMEVLEVNINKLLWALHIVKDKYRRPHN